MYVCVFDIKEAKLENERGEWQVEWEKGDDIESKCGGYGS